MKLLKLIGLLLWINLNGIAEANDSICGFPGTPASGYVKPKQDIYEKGDFVSYSCRVGFILLGSSIRKCKGDGTWTEEIPICDNSMTTLSFATSTTALPGHPAEMGIDRDKDTCTYLAPRKTRWWRIDLGTDHKVLSVAVTMVDTEKYTKFTVFVIKIEGSISLYKRCASFSGKFGTPTVVLSCADGKGIEGQRIHIDDHLQSEEVFELCEVEVQVEKDSGYECGQPDMNPYSEVDDIEDDEAQYSCLPGYELEGEDTRTCDNGKWLGEPPVCEAIVCDPLPPLENGELTFTMINGEVPLKGTVANYNCDDGYSIVGSSSINCLDDGTWDKDPPHCEVVRCSVPDGHGLGGVYRLVNKTTRMGSMALLKCKKGKMNGTNPYIVCTEDGAWSQALSKCLIAGGGVGGVIERPRIVRKEWVVFGMVVAGFMVLVVFASMFIVARRRKAQRPALPSRQIEAPEAPPRPPPRTKGILATTLLECVTGEKLSEEESEDVSYKSSSLPHKHSDQSNAVSPIKTVSMDKSVRQDSETDQEPRAQSRQSKTSRKSGGDEERVASDDETEAKGLKVNKGPASGKEYAAIDYEKKRQARFNKDKSSDSPVPPEDTEEPPTVPPKEMDKSEESETKSEDASDSGEKSSRNRAKAEPEADDPGSRRARRARIQAETPTEPEETPPPKVGAGRRRLRE